MVGSVVLSVIVVHWHSDLKSLCLNLTVVSFICNRCNFKSVLFLKCATHLYTVWIIVTCSLKLHFT